MQSQIVFATFCSKCIKSNLIYNFLFNVAVMKIINEINYSIEKIQKCSVWKNNWQKLTCMFNKNLVRIIFLRQEYFETYWISMKLVGFLSNTLRHLFFWKLVRDALCRLAGKRRRVSADRHLHSILTSVVCRMLGIRNYCGSYLYPATALFVSCNSRYLYPATAAICILQQPLFV